MKLLMYLLFLITASVLAAFAEKPITEDKVELFHFPDHQILVADPALKKELLEVISIATRKDKPEEGAKSEK